LRFLNWAQKLPYQLKIKRPKRMNYFAQTINYSQDEFYQNGILPKSAISPPIAEQIYEESSSGIEYQAVAQQYEMHQPDFDGIQGIPVQDGLNIPGMASEPDFISEGNLYSADIEDTLEIQQAINEVSQEMDGMEPQLEPEALPFVEDNNLQGQEFHPMESSMGADIANPVGMEAAPEPMMENGMEAPMDEPMPVENPMDMNLEQRLYDPYMNPFHPLYGMPHPFGFGPFGPGPLGPGM